MKHSIVFAMTFIGVLAAVAIAGNEAEDSARELLGFDLRQVASPEPGKGTPIARVFDEYLYPKDVGIQYLKDDGIDDRKLGEQAGRRLGGLVLGRLLERYQTKHTLMATKGEVDQFVKFLESVKLPGGDELPNDKAARDFHREMGEQSVLRWKIDRALYERYGGTVIFQQAHPLEPVGAYRKFLEEMEKAGVFAIFDKDDRTHALHYFTRKHPFQLRPADVNFDQPWWLQKPSPE